MKKVNRNLSEILKEQKIYPVLRGKDKYKIIEDVKALKRAGIELVEINVDSPQVYEAIEEVSSEIKVCAGGIITLLQAETAIKCGAKLFSSPILQPNLLKFSKNRQLPYIASTTTANEAYSAWKLRIPVIRLYPVTAMGGVTYLEDILRPMPFLNILPAGNIKLDEVNAYIKAGAVGVGVGRDLFENSTPEMITQKLNELLR